MQQQYHQSGDSISHKEASAADMDWVGGGGTGRGGGGSYQTSRSGGGGVCRYVHIVKGS